MAQFAAYISRGLCNPWLTFPRINGPNVCERLKPRWWWPLNQRKRAARPAFSIGKLFGLSAARYARPTRSWLSYVPAMWHWTDRCKTLHTRSARQRDLPVAPKGIRRRGKARTNSTEVLDCILMAWIQESGTNLREFPGLENESIRIPGMTIYCVTKALLFIVVVLLFIEVAC